MFNFFYRYKKKFLEIDDYEFSIFSKILILLFSIFIFFIIGFGVSNQLLDLKSPDVVFGKKCKELIANAQNIDLEYIEDDILDEDKNFAFGENRYCQDLNKLYLNLLNNELVNNNFKKYKAIDKEIGSTNQNIKTIKNSYDDFLLEEIRKGDSTLLYKNSKVIPKGLTNDETHIKNLLKEKELINDLVEHRDYQKLVEYMKINSELINKEIKEYVEDYPLLTIFNISIFLIPLFLISLLLSNYFLKKQQFIISRLFISITFISSGYLIYHLLNLFYKTIPKYIITSIADFFIQNNLLFILNYLIIIVVIAIFTLIIWKVQSKNKKSYSIKPSKIKFIKDNRCSECGCLKKDNFIYCPVCGESFYEECKSCGDLKIKNSPYCQFCGNLN